MIGRIDQQLFVTKTMISMYELRMISSKKLRKYMVKLSCDHDDCFIHFMYPL